MIATRVLFLWGSFGYFSSKLMSYTACSTLHISQPLPLCFSKKSRAVGIFVTHLKFLQILLRFVKGHSIIIPEMIENPFAFEIYLRHLLTLYHLFDLINNCLVFRTIKDL